MNPSAPNVIPKGSSQEAWAALTERWRSLLAALGAADDGAAAAVLAAIRDRYSEPHRFHHTLRHLSEVLVELDRLQRVHVQAFPEVEMALWFHDFVYDLIPGEVSNERASAQAAAAALRALTWVRRAPESVADLSRKVEALILATEHAGRIHADRNAQVITACDLAILGQPWERYLDYAHAIRAEYSDLYADPDYRAGRRGFLQATLGHPETLFQDEAARNQYLAQAIRNLERELDLLAEPIPASPSPSRSPSPSEAPLTVSAESPSVPANTLPEGCVLTACWDGEGWSLEVVNPATRECVAMLAWPASWPPTMTPADLERSGFEIV
jgi:predicted metal-dependent HD superfamily phosphohydrolase